MARALSRFNAAPAIDTAKVTVAGIQYNASILNRTIYNDDGSISQAVRLTALKQHDVFMQDAVITWNGLNYRLNTAREGQIYNDYELIKQ